jgi:quercetin dioxygenase-like cupin family protein
MRFAINNEPEQILRAGATFFEPSGAVHTTTGSARSDGPTRAVVFMLVPKGSPLTSPVA